MFAEPDTLLHFYEKYFSESLKSSYEGEEVKNLIYGKQVANARGIQKIQAPVFSTTDIFGKDISLKNNLGKKVTLINFWASWCGPCLAEMPAVKRIQQKYPSDQLEIITVSFDGDSSKFNDARLKYSMNWTNIYQDEHLGNQFGGVVSLPLLYLIDTDGNIIYNRTVDETDYKSLEQLNSVLERQFL